MINSDIVQISGLSKRVGVQVLDSADVVRASDSSTSSSTAAYAQWTRSSTYAHRHRATSAVVSR